MVRFQAIMGSQKGGVGMESERVVTKAIEPKAKHLALTLWVTFSLFWIGVMAAPLYLLRHTLAARTDYLILLPSMFVFATWNWLRFAYGVGKRLKSLPVKQGA
jgi:hypothetical protein